MTLLLRFWPFVGRNANGGTVWIVPPILGLTVSLAAAAGLGAPDALSQFVSGIDVVEVYATVTDSRGQVVTGLTIDDFLVSEDGRPQVITAFAAGEFPLAVAVGLDRSFSMTAERLAIAKAAARAFLDALRPGDRAMVVAIGSDIETIAPLSTDRARALAAIGRVDRWGTTPLYDATLAALEAIRPETGRRALVLLSDGDDRGSRTLAGALVERARRTDVLVYPIAIGRRPVPLFAELASATGGHAFVAPAAREATAAAAAVARELRFQYLLGYTPSGARPEESRWRSIQVSVARPNVHVRARDGFESR